VDFQAELALVRRMRADIDGRDDNEQEGGEA